VRIVLDTNVLIASLIAQGLCHDLLEHCHLNHHLITSGFVLNEVNVKLAVKFKFSEASAAEAVDLFASNMEIVEPGVIEKQVSRDADDEYILATAVAGNADCIITGDKDLLVLKDFKGIRILSPRAFVDQEEANT
jgi:putative PIN family toxin of toxin-antitoxin system